MLLSHPSLSGGGLFSLRPHLPALALDSFLKIVLQDFLRVVISSCRDWESMSVVFLLAVPFMEESPLVSLLLPPAALGSPGSTDPVGAHSGAFPEVL